MTVRTPGGVVLLWLRRRGRSFFSAAGDRETRNPDGATPIMRLDVRVKWAASANPAS